MNADAESASASDLEGLIPEGHKYAVRVLKTTFEVPTERVELAPGVFCLPELPDELPQSWKDWRGRREIARMRECPLVLVAVAPHADPMTYDPDSRALEDKLVRIHGALSIVTPGYYVQIGRTIAGGRDSTFLNAMNAGEVIPYFGAAGSPRNWGVRAKHLQQAIVVGDAMAAIRIQMTAQADRLTRIFHAFHLGMLSNVWDVRLHQFCRVLDGFAATGRGRGRVEFRNRCCRMIGDTAGVHGDFFEQAFEVRGAVEHLRGPVEQIRLMMPDLKTTEEAYLALAFTSFTVEQVARHALLHVCTTPELWPHVRDNAKAQALWSSTPAEADRLWNVSLDLLEVQRKFDRASAEMVLGL